MKNKFLEERKFSYFLILIVAFLIFFYFQSSLTFADPDAFYHAKMAVLIKERGIIRDFPWTQFSLYKNHYIDHHFLYHLFLLPFVIFLDPLMGLKAATLLFSVLSIFLFYWFLKKFKIKFAFFYSFLLLLTNIFVFRLSLGKAPVVSLIFLILGTYFIFKNKNIALSVLSFLYVWLYSAWPLILFFALIYSVVGFILFFFKKVSGKPSLKSLFFCSAGLLSGIIINPYFPKNLIYYRQIFKMALIPYHKIIEIGAEWYSCNFIDLAFDAPFIFILLAVALVLFFIFFKKQSQKTFFLLFISLFLFVYTLKARRQAEYFIPFAVSFCAFSLNDSLKGIVLKDYWLKFLEIFKKRKILIGGLLAYFFIAAPFTAIDSAIKTKEILTRRFDFNKLKKASLWLKENTPEKSIVFQSHWGIFPMLFFYNTHNYYLTGLDQTFMYEYNKELYWLWRDIVTGKKRENIYQIIKYKFNSSYVLADKENLVFNNSLKRDKRFKEIYKDEEVVLYQLTTEERIQE